MFNKYYQDELLYLRELGAEFARAHPTAAHFLAASESDPDVERLLEGFAFLSARVRQKLDDELPEVTHALMALLWPHYLRPIPAMSILELQPVLAALRQSKVVPRGAEVQSVPVEGTPCRFRTAFAVALHPLSLESVQLEATAAGPSRITIAFKLWNQAKPETLKLDRLRLHLSGDPALSFELYVHLRDHVREALVTATGGRGTASRPIRIEPVGAADEEALLPYPARSLPGYRLLQEYFALPEKFLFLDLVGLERLAEISSEDRFTVEIRFDRALPANLRPTKEEVRLYCTPITNLFPHEADPIRVDHSKVEYRLRPSGQDPLHYEVFSIDRVAGKIPGTAQEQEIPAFYAFRDGGTAEPRKGAGAGAPATRIAWYFARQRTSPVDERSDTYLSFVDEAGASILPPVETVSTELTCTNRKLPEALRIGDVQVPTDSSPEFVRFRNLTVPTRSVPPPLEGDLHWRLISHLSLNYISLTSVEALRGILGLYNFQAVRDSRSARANMRRIEGIESVRSRPVDRLVQGSLVRGTTIEIDLREDHFAGEGDLYLFANVLNEFLSLHASLNSFTQLTVRGSHRGEVYTWPCRTGRQILL